MNPIVIIYVFLCVWMSLFAFLDKPNTSIYMIILGLSVLILEPIRKRIMYENKEYKKFKEDMRRD